MRQRSLGRAACSDSEVLANGAVGFIIGGVLGGAAGWVAGFFLGERRVSALGFLLGGGVGAYLGSSCE